MIDHVGIYAIRYAESRKFYERIFTTLDIGKIDEYKEISRVGFGSNDQGKSVFWITEAGLPFMRTGDSHSFDTPEGLRSLFPMLRMHILFKANSHKDVNHFYEMAMEAGAKSNGVPKLSRCEQEKIYVAYVIDPDGHNIGAIFTEEAGQGDSLDDSMGDSSPISRVGIYVTEYRRSKFFYEKALLAIGCGPTREFREINRVGFSSKLGGKSQFWITGTGATDTRPYGASIASSPAFPMMRLHVAFRAESPDQVDRFYEEALDADGRSNGVPGPRAEYRNTYYAGYVSDPDGHNIEAVCHQKSAADDKDNDGGKRPGDPKQKVSFLL